MGTHLITGVAGFLGSHLAEGLIAGGHQVVGVDRRENLSSLVNISELLGKSEFILVQKDLGSLTLTDLPDNIDIVFHLAGRPGVRSSWGQLEAYLSDNVLATQHLLDLLLQRPVQRVLIASTSSVYGDGTPLPAREDGPLRPLSPYAVSKLACEALSRSYWYNFKLPIIVLRYFTLYGPRQRSDMAFSRFAQAMYRQEAIQVFGDGSQRRDFTFIDDAVEGTMLASVKGQPGEVYNIATGREIVLETAIKYLQELMKKEARVVQQGIGKGESYRTWGDISKARTHLGYEPKTNIREGLARFLNWFEESLRPRREG